MSNKILNNQNNWKRKLDELDDWPAASMPDKNVAFKRLHGRLTGKRSDKKVVWYWAAAACLLFAIIAPFAFRKSSAPPISETVASYPQSKESPVDDNKDSIQKSLVEGKPPSLKIKEPFIASGINNKQKKIIPVEQRSEIRLYDTVSRYNVSTEIFHNSLKRVDTSSIVTIMPAKKSLKVVHVNELGDPVDVPHDIANKKELHSFQLRLASQEVYNGKPVALNKKEFTIFSTKPSSN
jgi:hypothetical protein